MLLCVVLLHCFCHVLYFVIGKFTLLFGRYPINDVTHYYYCVYCIVVVCFFTWLVLLLLLMYFCCAVMLVLRRDYDFLLLHYYCPFVDCYCAPNVVVRVTGFPIVPLLYHLLHLYHHAPTHCYYWYSTTPRFLPPGFVGSMICILLCNWFFWTFPGWFCCFPRHLHYGWFFLWLLHFTVPLTLPAPPLRAYRFVYCCWFLHTTLVLPTDDWCVTHYDTLFSGDLPFPTTHTPTLRTGLAV